MEINLPVKYIHENMILAKNGDIWAYYKIRPESISNNNTDISEASKNKMANFLGQIAKYKDFHLQIYPKNMNLNERFSEIAKDFHPDSKKIGLYYLSEFERMLTHEFGTVTEPSYVIGVRIKNNLFAKDLKSTILNAVESVTDRIFDIIGYNKKITEQYFNDFKILESDLAKIVTMVNGFPMTENELVYLNRYNFLRGVSHSVFDEQKNKDIFSIADSILDPTINPSYIKMTTSMGDSYVTFVPVSDTLQNLKFNHMARIARDMNFPVEFHIKGEFMDFSQTKTRINRTGLRLKQTEIEANIDGDPAFDSIRTGRYLLNKLQNEIEKKVPQIKWLACFVVAGDTKEICKRRSDSLIRYLDSYKIKAVRPMADQMNLFYKTMHGEPLQGYKNWIQNSNNRALAEILFATSDLVGNNVGFYIGRVDNLFKSENLQKAIHSSKKIVLNHPTITNKGITGAKTDSPHIVITGETGKGKSYLVKMLFMYTTFLNAKLLYIDPKKEIRNWFSVAKDNKEIGKKYPFFIEHLQKFHYITLDVENKNNWGVLDPIVFLKRAAAKDTAESMIEQIYDTNGKDMIKTEILKGISEAIRKREQGEKVGLMYVIEKLRKNGDREIHSAGDLLYEQIKGSVLQLAFSDGQCSGLNLQSRINILEVSGLDLPKETDDPNYYSDIEKKSVALMIPIGKFCEKFGSDNPREDTVEIFDEAWIFNVAKGGKKILKSMRRVGRSANNMLVFATQSVNDVTSNDDHGNFGTIFAFDEPAERVEILKHLGIENTEANIKSLSEMIKGQCFHRDIYGRVAKINIHCPFEEMDIAFRTNLKNYGAVAEEKYS